MSHAGSVAKKVNTKGSPRTKGLSREAFKVEVHDWANRIGVKAKEIHVRPMKRKWASCSTMGRFSFNEELLSKPHAFRSEVIVHEVLHMKVPNHGKLFKALLKSYLTVAEGD